MNEWSLSTLLNPIPKFQHALLPFKVLWAKERAPILPSSVIFYLDSHLSPSRSWECVKFNVGLDASTPLLDDANVVHVVQVSPSNIQFKGTMSSFMGVSMNTQIFINMELDWTTYLLTSHQQAKFWATYSYKSIPWAFFLIQNGNIPHSDQVQQFKCIICVPHVIPPALIEKNKKKKKR